MSSPVLRQLAALLVASLLLAQSAPAHESASDALAQLDAALALAPGDASLWHRRAALERGRGGLERAKADLARACALGLAPATAERERGLLAQAQGSLAEAEIHLRRARSLAPDDLETLVAHADVLADLERFREAADALTRAVALAPHAGPDLHLARVRALAAGGAADASEALRALDLAIARLGPVPALVQEGVALELGAGRTDAALARLDRLRAPARPQAGLLVQRAEILERAGRSREAAAEYDAALASLDALPPARRAAPATLTLATRAHDGIARLEGDPGAQAR